MQLIFHIDHFVDDFNLTAVQENADVLIPLFNESSSYEFFLAVGSKQDVLDKLALVSSLIQQDTKLKSIVKELLDDDFSDIIGLVPGFLNTFDLDPILSKAFDALNLETKPTKDLINYICSHYNDITLGYVLDRIGINLHPIYKFFQELEKTFTPGSAVTFVNFLENIGFDSSLSSLEKLLLEVANGKSIYLDELFNETYDVLENSELIETVVKVVRNLLENPLKTALNFLGKVFDFRYNTLENRIDSLLSLIEYLSNFDFLENSLPGFNELILNVKKKILDIKSNGIQFQEFNIDLVNISIILNKINNKNHSVVKSIIEILIEDNETVDYLYNLIDSLSNDSATLTNLIESICGLIGGEETISSFHNITETILDPTISIKTNSSAQTFVQHILICKNVLFK